MDKLCCCLEQDLPDISVNVTCACCDSRVEEKNVNEGTDLDLNEKEEAKKENMEEENTTCCCCFRRKRHAKLKKKKTSQSHDGKKT